MTNRNPLELMEHAEALERMRARSRAEGGANIRASALKVDWSGQKHVAESGAVKNDAGKLRYDLMPAGPLEDIVKVLTLGANKYADRNWEKGFPWSRPYAALMRHLWAWWKGEDKDPEWGMSHLAHAACCLIFLMEFENTHKELDDRPK